MQTCTWLPAKYIFYMVIYTVLWHLSTDEDKETLLKNPVEVEDPEIIYQRVSAPKKRKLQSTHGVRRGDDNGGFKNSSIDQHVNWRLRKVHPLGRHPIDSICYPQMAFALMQVRIKHLHMARLIVEIKVLAHLETTLVVRYYIQFQLKGLIQNLAVVKQVNL